MDAREASFLCVILMNSLISRISLGCCSKGQLELPRCAEDERGLAIVESLEGDVE